MSVFKRTLNQQAVASTAAALGASVLTPIEDAFAAFPVGVRNTMTADDDTVYFVPFVIDRPCTIESLSIEVTTQQSDTTARFAIYSVTDDGKPGALLGETATVATTSQGVAGADIQVPLGVGAYFAAVKIDGSSVAIRSVNSDSSRVSYGDAAGDVDGAAASGEGVFTQGSVATSFPSEATVGAARGVAAPLVIVEFNDVEA